MYLQVRRGARGSGAGAVALMALPGGRPSSWMPIIACRCRKPAFREPAGRRTVTGMVPVGQLAVITPVAYSITVGAAIVVCAVTTGAARRSPGRWAVVEARIVGTVLAVDAASYIVSSALAGRWSPSTGLPLALCNVAVLVAALACWWPLPLLVELTWFWGLAGTLQAVITPDLNVGFPHLVFFQYLVGHLGIVFAAVFLVVGMRIVPRPGAVLRVFTLSVAYTAVVGLIDALAGANYMFLAQPPGEWTVLRLMGPWPWYVLTASAVALGLFIVLDLPFRPGRRRPPRRSETAPARPYQQVGTPR